MIINIFIIDSAWYWAVIIVLMLLIANHMGSLHYDLAIPVAFTVDLFRRYSYFCLQVTKPSYSSNIGLMVETRAMTLDRCPEEKLSIVI